jgi:hypothetical protein
LEYQQQFTINNNEIIDTYWYISLNQPSRPSSPVISPTLPKRLKLGSELKATTRLEN